MKITGNQSIVALVIVIVVVLALGGQFGLFASVGGPSLTRSASSTVNPGETFSVTYSTSGAPNDRWFVAWEDDISGGCAPAEYNSFLASELGGDESKTKSFTAPQSGSCTFTGYYQYADNSQQNFNPLTINICAPDSCSSLGYNCGTWSNGCGGTLNCGSPGANQICDAGQLRTCNTDADTNCDGTISFSELNAFANLWVAGSKTFSELINIATAWVNG